MRPGDLEPPEWRPRPQRDEEVAVREARRDAVRALVQAVAVIGTLLALAALLTGCAGAGAVDRAALARELDRTVAAHPGALKGASPEAEALFDDLICMTAAVADVAEAWGCGDT